MSSWDRGDSQGLQAALRQARRVEDRVLVALWHFAGRWGDIEERGHSVKLTSITGEVLARFVGARRQAVSTALGKLTDAGRITRRADRSVFIPDQPLQLKAIEGGRRATDRAPRVLQRR